MRTRLLIVALAIVALACGAGSSPAPTVPAEPQTQYGQSVQRANEVADQVNQREADLEQMVADMDG